MHGQFVCFSLWMGRSIAPTVWPVPACIDVSASNPRIALFSLILFLPYPDGYLAVAVIGVLANARPVKFIYRRPNVDPRNLDKIAAACRHKRDERLGRLLLVVPGQGICQYKKENKGHKLIRNYIRGVGEFTVTLRFRPSAEKSCIESVEQALIAIGLLGGLGSRSRRGWGSISLRGLYKVVGKNRESIWSPPRDMCGLGDAIKELKKNSYSGTPPYSAISSKLDVLIWGNEKTALGLLNKIGDTMSCYRSIYGKGTFYPHDYDIAKNVAMSKKSTGNPKRVVFGLPHNYYFSSIKRKVDIQPISKDRTRRASPLFIHIHEVGYGNYCAVQSLLESVFLPKGDEIEMTGYTSTSKLTPVVDFNIIRDYFKEFTGGITI
jgi:CRISPR-associated protein Cmr1